MSISMQATKKGIIFGSLFTAVVYFMYQKVIVEDHSEQNSPTQSHNVNILYKNSGDNVKPPTHNDYLIINITDQVKTHGYLLALRIMEQQTTGAKNVLQLGCLAMSMGLRAVEPYAANSFFFYPLSSEEMNLKQQFSDYYSSVSVKKNYKHASFDKWNTFLNRAPKKIIFVHLSYETIPSGSQATVVPVDNCHLTSNFKDFISHYGFIIVRCIDYVFTDETGPAVKLTDPTDFSRTIFGHYHPSEVNVVISKWKGLGTRTRIPLNTNCRNIYSRQLMPSQSLMRDSDKYIRTYLQRGQYISIMLRTEKIILHSDGKNENDFSRELAGCYQRVRDTVAKIRETSSEELDIFMTVDLGLFGTKGDSEFKTGKQSPTDGPVYLTTLDFMKDMHGNPQWSLQQWEQTFLDTLGNKNDSGYIAGLQRTVATKGTCLIVVGGGSFQQLAIDLYENFHSTEKRDCLFKVCST